MQYIHDEALKRGFSQGEAEWFVAQAITENGAMTHDRLGDNGCSIGMYQWNNCARGKTDDVTYQDQVDTFLNEMAEKVKEHSFLQASISWNSPKALNSNPKEYKYYKSILKNYEQTMYKMH